MQPEQLDPTILEHLALANEVRSKRASDKKKLKAGKLDPTGILEDPPRHWSTAEIIDLLIVLPRVGRVKAQKWLQAERVDPSTPIGQISLVKRRHLAYHVGRERFRRDELRRQMDDS
jgi:hypothetical protein